MVTDTFDSVKFRLTDTHTFCNEEAFDRANAAVVEFLLFHEEPLELTFPQLFDGYFASVGTGTAQRQDLLFDLLRRGHIKITSYYPEMKPTANPLAEYLARFPFKNVGFKYSTMPFLTDHIGITDSGTSGMFDQVKEYILLLFAGNAILHRPRIIDDGTALATELQNFMSFFERLADCECIRDGSAFRFHRAALPNFSAFLQNAFSEPSHAAAVFSLTGRENLLDTLLRCKSRSECNEALNRLPNPEMTHIRQNALDALYNKFTFSVFPDHEINIPSLFSVEQTDLLREILEKCDEGSKKNLVRYRKNETKQMLRTDHTASCISVKEALELRGEVERLRQKDSHQDWYDAVRKYREKLNIELFHAEENGDYGFFVEGTKEKQMFTVSEGMAAAVKLSKLENTMKRYENTFTFKETP